MKVKKITFLLLLLLLLTFSLSACGAAKISGETVSGRSVTENSGSTMSHFEPSSESSHGKKNGAVESETMIKGKITIGNKVFTAAFYDNEATQALLLKLPMTVNMTELNGKEKYYHLSENLPAKSTELPATIKAGEIMCWSSNTLVLFYNTYSNSYGGYVRLGYISDISGLKEALGTGNVQVTFEVSH